MKPLFSAESTVVKKKVKSNPEKRISLIDLVVAPSSNGLFDTELQATYVSGSGMFDEDGGTVRVTILSDLYQGIIECTDGKVKIIASTIQHEDIPVKIEVYDQATVVEFADTTQRVAYVNRVWNNHTQTTATKGKSMSTADDKAKTTEETAKLRAELEREREERKASEEKNAETYQKGVRDGKKSASITFSVACTGIGLALLGASYVYRWMKDREG